jgi:hypothetical protein
MVIQIEINEIKRTFNEVKNFLEKKDIVFFDMKNTISNDERIFIEIFNNDEESIEDFLNNFLNQHLGFNSDDFIMIF